MPDFISYSILAGAADIFPNDKMKSVRESISFRRTYQVFSKIYFAGKEDRITESISRTKKKKKSLNPLKRELEFYRKKGVSLYLDGKPSSPKSIAKACQIAEKGGYMRDYTEDERGRIARVDFDFIQEK